MEARKPLSEPLKKVLVIVGPTAVGKTGLSIQLSKELNGEIISGDSLQVYRTLDIGTAKVTSAEREGIPHYLIDVRDITERYSVADFQKEARTRIDEIHARGKLPIVVGGTGLYIQALLYDFKLGNEKEDDERQEKIRFFLEEQTKDESNEEVWRKLQSVDRLAASKIHFNNRRKVLRALEVFMATGHSIMIPKEQPKKIYNYFLVGLTTDRSKLYQRINQRVDLMMTQGLLEEAKKLENQQDLQAAQGIGYKELFPYFSGDQSLEKAIETIKQNSRRYAKRQLTWFRNRMSPYWFDMIQKPDTVDELIREIKKWKE